VRVNGQVFGKVPLPTFQTMAQHLLDNAAIEREGEAAES